MLFRVKAVDASECVVVTEMEATGEAALRELAKERGYDILSARPRGLGRPLAFARREHFPTTLFSIELLALLEAGLNLVEAMQALAERDQAGERRRVLSGIVDALYQGESFSQAITRFPAHFGSLYIATVQASERTGDLPEALRRHIAYQEDIDRVRKKIISASLYPAILLVVGSLVLAFLIFYVVPRFARVYEDISGDLPLFSAMLLSVGRWIEGNGWTVLAIVAGLIGMCAHLFSRPSFRARVNERLWQLPSLGERMRIYQLARLYRTLGMLLRAGVPIVRAIDMVSGLLAGHLRGQLSAGKRLLEEGHSISRAFTSAGLSTPVATRMLVVGERSGKMGELMERIARFYDDETSRYIEWFIRLFEPLLMTLLGLAVGLVVVLMYMPIFELASGIQ